MRAGIDIAEPVSIADLEKGILIPREDFELWLEKHDWTWQQTSRNEFPDFVYRRYYTQKIKMRKPFTGIGAFQLACIANDKYLFSQILMREPSTPEHKEPFSLFEHQKESLRIQSHTIHKCGTGVGKTREMIIVCTHAFQTEINGRSLVGAVQQEHINDVIEGMVEQMIWNPDLAPGLKHHTKHPHHTMYGANGHKLWFRPASHDGHAFRGKHATTLAIYEEAAKADQDLQWSEFFRAVKYSCIVKIYSVPDGRRDTHFYRISKLAEGLKNADEEKSLSDALKNIPTGGKKFILCQFPKTMMPDPHWNDDVKAEAITMYGGEDKPGYKHNILAEDGDPENTVFPWNEFKWVIKDIPEYRFLSIVVNAGEVMVRGHKFEFKQGADGPVACPVEILKTTHNFSGFFHYDLLSTSSGGIKMTESIFQKTIKSFFVGVPGYNRVGGDFGYSKDPTEILVKNIIGTKKRVVARLQLKYVSYDHQAVAMDTMDDIYCMMNTVSGGMDIGNAGTALMSSLHGLPQFREKKYEDRLKGFQFESSTDNVDENGDPILDAKDGKPAKITLKELATDHMTRRVQRQTAEYPPDPDIISSYTGHTCTQGKHRIYSKNNDHIIDADRAETLAEIFSSIGESQFASGSYRR